MNNGMQISYWTIGGFENAKPIETALAEAKKMGYDGVELSFGGGVLGPGTTEKQCRDYRLLADRLGMPIRTVATGAFWNMQLSDPDAARRRKALAFAKAYLRAAAWLGAATALVIPGVVAVPWEPKQPAVPYAMVWKNATQSVKSLAGEAEKLGVTIGLENVWGWFLTDPMALSAFIDQFKSPRVAAYFDVANCAINGYPEHWLEILGKRVAAVHVKNFSRGDCGGGLHGFGDDILKGDVNLPAVLAMLRKIKYKGPITAEMIPFSRLPDLSLPDLKLAKDTAKKLRKLMDKA